MKIDRDDDFWTILICAVRYSIGRRTYMPGLVTDWIMANASDMPKGTAEIMLRDIQEQREFGERLGVSELGAECDVKTWTHFENWLKKVVKTNG